MRVVYCAAHATADSERVALGGGGAICGMLAHEWERTRPFEFELIGPAILGAGAPSGASLIRYGERAYAEFCDRFRAAATERILREDPDRTVVLVNDISEAPDFERIARAGFPIATIYHVDVVAYVASIYLRGLVSPETTVRWFDRFERFWVPPITRLVWANQRASVRHSRALIMPSAGMRDVIERCYPGASEKVAVMPWGVPSAAPVDEAEVERLLAEFAVPRDAFVLLTLSRISPEKGQDTLLAALAEWERSPEFPSQPVVLFLCGGAAYMHGERYLATLRRLASRLRRVRVHFAGHVTGERKSAFFALADLYVFPSKHESYGLTLLEALRAGLPAVCVAHHGSAQVMRPEFGVTVPAGSLSALWRAIAELGADPARRPKMAEAARAFAASQRFEETAAKLARMLIGML